MRDAEAHNSETYTLDPHNGLTPAGEALKSWARYALPLLLSVEGGDSSIDAFASKSADGKRLTVWLLNRAYTPREIRMPHAGFNVSRAFRFSGVSPADIAPKWTELPRATFRSLSGSGELVPPLSLTILLLTAK
jgi:hypothetical protein